MTSDIEELLREGIGRITADASVPAGLVARALRHRRQRRRTAAAMVTAGTAAVAAAAVLAAAGGFSASPRPEARGGLRATAAAYVVQHVAHALDQQHLVVREESTYPGVAGGFRQMLWAYHGRARFESFLNGLPAQDDGQSVVNGKLRSVEVMYPSRVWYLFPNSVDSGAANGCGPGGLTSLGVEPASWASFIRQTLACGGYTIVGHARIGGVDTIEIGGGVTQRSPRVQGTSWVAHLEFTLFVDPSTYLPVRAVTADDQRTTPGSAKTASGRSVEQEDFEWLAPTPANIAQVNVPIPAGFRQIHGPVSPPFPAVRARAVSRAGH
jgi:hypothetical protein